MNAPAKKSKLIKGATGDWEVVIGLEVHAQVTSQSKLFSGASTEFGGAPNSHVSLVDAAMPGMLPVINRECIKQAIRTGLGLNATINPKSVFERKNYFYPDLPQGYQISQYESPIVGEGYVAIVTSDGETIDVGIERLHLEQDAGKSLHDQHHDMSLVDLNRSGIALMEIVSKPDLHSAEEAMTYVGKLRTIMRDLGTCNGDMEKGSLRADVNVSVRRPGDPLGTRCEIKNVNSIRFIGQAIEHEARRQIALLEDGGRIEQETRLFDPNKGETRPMRNKEEAHDYRYFPDPDLLPLEIAPELVAELKAQLPESSDERRARFIRNYGLSAYDADVLTAEKERAKFYEKMLSVPNVHPKAAANWVINEVLGRLNKTDPARLRGQTFGPTGPQTTWSVTLLGPTGPSANSAIVVMTSTNVLSGRTAKEAMDALWERGLERGPVDDPRTVELIVEERGLRQVTDVSEIARIVDEVLARNPDKVAQAKAKPTVAGWFVGQVMKASGGKANPGAVNELVKRKLGI
jgi:aspartyl-tRNA(Asn)/glutamyl-tRNA(Gln) amidotransferase subunit B